MSESIDFPAALRPVTLPLIRYGAAGLFAPLAVAVLLCGSTAAEESRLLTAVPALRPVEQQFRRTVQPILADHCIDCHTADDPSGGVVLQGYDTPEKLLSDIRLWEKVAKTQREKSMPPEDGDPPSDEGRTAVIAWVGSATKALSEAAPFDPGPMLYRRLNRREYANTIRDLLGIDFDVATAVGLPPDQKAFGYDTIAAALDIPPLLMEKYVAAADEVLDRVVVDRPWSQKFEVEDLPHEILQAMPEPDRRDKAPIPPATLVKDGVRMIHTPAAVNFEVDIREGGHYAIRVRCWRERPKRARNVPELHVQVAGQTRKSARILAPKNKPEVKSLRVYLPQGKTEITLACFGLPAGPPWKSDRFSTVGLDWIEITGPVSASGVRPDPAAHARIFYTTAAESGGQRAAARRIVRRFAARSFRRVPTDAEIDKLMTLFDKAQSRGATFEKSVGLMLKAVLISPQFLFRTETLRPELADQPYRVTDFELASRLSYFLWSTMPDKQLLKTAEAGQLSDPNTLRAEVSRMLADEKAESLINDFAAQWLHLDKLEMALPSEEHFPSFSQRVRSAMRAEVEVYLRHIIKEDRSVLELIDSDYMFTNRELTLHYRVRGTLDRDKGFVKTATERHPERGGLLGMGAILAMTSHVARNSPTMRGKWVLEVMLGDPPPPPPANVEQIDEEVGDKKRPRTFRELLAAHADQSSACAGCHQKMDPLGFALDNFDPVGRWQTERDGQKIDAVGILPDGRKVDGAIELKKLLMQEKDRFVRNLIEQMLTYALGRKLQYYDRPTIARIHERLKAADYRFSALVLGIAESYPMHYRRNPRATDFVSLKDNPE